jgi:chitinase
MDKHPIPSDLCTHVLYDGAGISVESRTIFPLYDGDVTSEKDGKTGVYTKLQSLKKRNPSLRLVLSVGALQKADGKKLGVILADGQTLSDFTQNILSYLQKHGFNGLHLDWRYPSNHYGDISGDARLNFVRLVKVG